MRIGLSTPVLVQTPGVSSAGERAATVDDVARIAQVGGRTHRSLRRAVTLGDGWMPFGLSGVEISEMLARVTPPEGFDVVLATRPLDVSGDPARVLRRLRGLGATAVSCALVADCAAHFADQLPELRALADQAGQE